MADAEPRLIRQEDEDFSGNSQKLEFWRARFASYSEITGFYEINSESTTHANVSGTERISAVNDYRSGFGIDATSSGNNRPQYLPTGGPGGRPAAEFDIVGPDNQRLLMPDAFSIPTSNFFSACLFYGPTDTMTLVGNLNGATNRHGLRLLSNGKLVHTVGTNGGLELNPEVEYLGNTWSLALGSWNHSSKTSRVRLLYPGFEGGAEESDVATVLGTGSQYIGDLGTNLKVAFAIIGVTDLLDFDGYIHDAIYRDIVKYCEDRYRLKF